MNFTLSITLAALNAIMAITCLVASGKHTKHPFGVYLAAAMLLWWPVMIYPILFASERKAAAEDTRLRNIFKEGVTSCDVAQNIVVVKTMPGLAPGAGAALDAMELEGLVGSLAGDDTVILIMRTAQAAEGLTREIESMLEE